MRLSDFKLLKKFMQMTMSGSDTEILFALRKANVLLVAEGVDWDRVLDRMVHLEVEAAPREPKPGRTEAQEIDEAFAEVEASDPRGSFADFIASLKEQWDDRRSLSDKQKAALFDAVERTRR